jgi:hypothetical protein
MMNAVLQETTGLRWDKRQAGKIRVVVEKMADWAVSEVQYALTSEAGVA